MSDPITEQRAQDLAADGWREYPNRLKDYARCFYKRFATATRCYCNDDKGGMQVCIALSREGHAGFPPGFTMDMSGELKDGSWVKLVNYGMRDSLEDSIAAIPRLLAAWEAFNQETP
jgi:hypothetical protein